VKSSDAETYQNEAQGPSLSENAGSTFPICSNGNFTEVVASFNNGANKLETTTSDYCELEEVARGGIKRDSQYDQLDHGRNYEPFTVYEQLQ